MTATSSGRRHWRFEDSQTIFGPKGLEGWMVSILRCHLGKKNMSIGPSLMSMSTILHIIYRYFFLFSIGCWVQYHILPSTEWLHHHSRRPRAAKESLNLSRETWVKDLAKTVLENHGCHWWYLVFHCRTTFSQKGTIYKYIWDTDIFSLLVCLDSFKGNVEFNGTPTLNHWSRPIASMTIHRNGCPFCPNLPAVW